MKCLKSFKVKIINFNKSNNYETFLDKFNLILKFILFVTIYIVSTLIIFDYYPIITIPEYTIDYVYGIVLFIALAFIISIVIIFSTSKKYGILERKEGKSPKAFSTLIGLIIATFFVVLLISFPIYFGGIKDSFMAPILIALCGYTIIFPKSRLMKIVFLTFSFVILLFLTIFSVKIVISSEYEDFYLGLYFTSTIFAIATTIIISLAYNVRSQNK